MNREDLSPRARLSLASCIGSLYGGQSFTLEIGGTVKYLCYRGSQEALPRIPKDMDLVGANMAGLFVSADSFEDGMTSGEPTGRRWFFAGNLDELHLVLDGLGLEVESVLQAMAAQASQRLQDDQFGASAAQDFIPIDCVIAGVSPTERQLAQLQAPLAPDAVVGGDSYSPAQLQAAVSCAAMIQTAYAQASEDNGGCSSVEWSLVDLAHGFAHEVFTPEQHEAFQQQARAHNGYRPESISEKP